MIMMVLRCPRTPPPAADPPHTPNHPICARMITSSSCGAAHCQRCLWRHRCRAAPSSDGGGDDGGQTQSPAPVAAAAEACWVHQALLPPRLLLHTHWPPPTTATADGPATHCCQSRSRALALHRPQHSRCWSWRSQSRSRCRCCRRRCCPQTRQSPAHPAAEQRGRRSRACPHHMTAWWWWWWEWVLLLLLLLPAVAAGARPPTLDAPT